MGSLGVAAQYLCIKGKQTIAIWIHLNTMTLNVMDSFELLVTMFAAHLFRFSFKFMSHSIFNNFLPSLVILVALFALHVCHHFHLIL